MFNYFFVSGYARESEPGIHYCELDSDTGKIKVICRKRGIKNPTYLSVSRDQERLYAVSEDRDGGEVYSYIINYDTLSYTGKQKTSGKCPVHVYSYDPDVIVSNYIGGSLDLYKTDLLGAVKPSAQCIQHEGSGPNPERQDHAYVHCAHVKGSRIYVADLGSDTVSEYIYKKGLLERTKVIPTPPGTGPRMITSFKGQKSLLYVVCELTSDVLIINSRTKKVEQVISALPDGFEGENLAAALCISEDGRFLYVSNRGLDAITVFSIHEITGHLTKLCLTPTGGKCPRDIELFGGWLLAAHQDSDEVTVLKRNPASGMLTLTDERYFMKRPVCVVRQI